MASIHKERRGDKSYYRLQFYDKDNRRRSIRLGDVNRRSADAIRVKVEDLLSASIAGNTPSNETSRWLADIGQDLAGKLTTAGFGKYIPKRESASLGAFLTAYIEGRKAEVAESTVTKFENVRQTLVEYFGEDKDLREISEGDADDWRQSLIEQSAEATVSKLVKRARQFFKSAVRKGLADIWPLNATNTPLDRLAARSFDSAGSFKNRIEGLELMRLREAGGLGSFLGGRFSACATRASSQLELAKPRRSSLSSAG